jgi:hypothetical protein
MSRRVAPRPSAAACFPVSSPILTARRQVLWADAAWFMASAPARCSSPRPATCLSPSFLSTTPKHRRLLSYLLTATHHSSPSFSSRRGMDHSVCSGMALFIAPSH